MRIILLLLIGLALPDTIVQAATPPTVIAKAENVPRVEPDGAFDLQVTAMRPLPQSSGLELVFSEPSAAMLRKFSQHVTGRDVDFVIGGHTIATLKLRDPIIGNSVMLTGTFTEETRHSMNEAAEKGIDIRLHQ